MAWARHILQPDDLCRYQKFTSLRPNTPSQIAVPENTLRNIQRDHYCFFKLIKSQSKWQYTGRIKKKLNPDFSHQRLIYWEISPLPWKNYVFENIVITLENIKGGLAPTKSDKSLSSASYFHSTTSDAVIYFHLKYSTVKWLQSTLYPKLKIVSWSLGLECLGFSSHVLDIWFPYFHMVDDVMTHRPRQEFGCKMQIF